MADDGASGLPVFFLCSPSNQCCYYCTVCTLLSGRERSTITNINPKITIIFTVFQHYYLLIPPFIVDEAILKSFLCKLDKRRIRNFLIYFILLPAQVTQFPLCCLSLKCITCLITMSAMFLYYVLHIKTKTRKADY